MKYSALMILFVVLLAGCSKDKRNARRLSGTWNLAELTVGDITHMDDLGTFTFADKCKVKDGGCEGMITTASGIEEPFEWTSVDNVLYITGTGSDGITDYTGKYTVTEHKKKRYVLTTTDAFILAGNDEAILVLTKE